MSLYNYPDYHFLLSSPTRQTFFTSTPMQLNNDLKINHLNYELLQMICVNSFNTGYRAFGEWNEDSIDSIKFILSFLIKSILIRYRLLEFSTGFHTKVFPRQNFCMKY